MSLLHELDTVSKVHPDPLTRELLRRAYNALYHLSLELNKPKHTPEDELKMTTKPAIPFVGYATEEDRL